MKPYWITFGDPASSIRPGMGVTAYSEEDALRLVEAVVITPDIASVREVVDVQELDQSHVVPNMGNLLKRGIWFPIGYEHVR